VFVAELCKDIEVAIPDIVEWMSNSDQEVSISVLELLSELVTCCMYHYCCLIDMLNYLLQLTLVMQWKWLLFFY